MPGLQVTTWILEPAEDSRKLLLSPLQISEGDGTEDHFHCQIVLSSIYDKDTHTNLDESTQLKKANTVFAVHREKDQDLLTLISSKVHDSSKIFAKLFLCEALPPSIF